MGIYMSKLVKVYTLITCSLLYANYASIILVFKLEKVCVVREAGTRHKWVWHLPPRPTPLAVLYDHNRQFC